MRENKISRRGPIHGAPVYIDVTEKRKKKPLCVLTSRSFGARVPYTIFARRTRCIRQSVWKQLRVEEFAISSRVPKWISMCVLTMGTCASLMFMHVACTWPAPAGHIGGLGKPCAIFPKECRVRVSYASEPSVVLSDYTYNICWWIGIRTFRRYYFKRKKNHSQERINT